MKKVLFLSICLFLLAGCTPVVPFREVEQLRLVQTLGFDVSPGGYTVSASLPGVPEGASAVQLTAFDSSVDGAVRALNDYAAQEELYFAHVRYAVLGEAAARQGIDAVLDHFLRSTQVRLDTPLFLVRGGEAREAVTLSGDENYEISALLASILRDGERSGAAYGYTLLDTAVRLSRSGAALVCALELTETGENVPSAEEGTRTVLYAGYGVLKNGRLVGWLDGAAARGADLLAGRSRGALYLLEDGRGGRVAVELRGGGVTLTPLRDERGVLTLAVRAEFAAGVTEAEDGSFSQTSLAALDAALSRAVAEDITAALNAAATLGADFPELWLALRRRAPADFAENAPADFPRGLPLRVEAVGTLERSYDIDESAETEMTGHAG